VNQFYSKALENNKNIKAKSIQLDASKSFIKSAFSFEKTNVYYSFDQNNLATNNLPLRVFGVQQSFEFPSVYLAQKKVNNAAFNQENNIFELEKLKLKQEIFKVYHQIVFIQNKEKLYHYLDSLYQNFSKASDRRFELGETNYLEKITAQAKYRKIQTNLQELKFEKKAQLALMQYFIQTNDSIVIKTNELKPLLQPEENHEFALKNYLESISEKLNQEENLLKKQRLPSLNLEYFQGTNSGISQSLYGFQVGVGLQILNTGNKAKIKSHQLKKESWEQEKENQILKINQFLKQKNNELQQHQKAMDYYTKYGKKLSDEILKVANSSYKHGEIDFFQYIISLENSIEIKISFLVALNLYNTTILELQYINLQ
jgi:cobalt-zinc-cadmium resistance protein CzcA